jgi:hypothetical protein
LVFVETCFQRFTFLCTFVLGRVGIVYAISVTTPTRHKLSTVLPKCVSAKIPYKRTVASCTPLARQGLEARWSTHLLPSSSTHVCQQ